MSTDFSALLSMLSPFPGTTSGWFFNAAVLTIGISFSIWFSTIYRKTKSRQLLNSLPGLWTSLGILGTFMAICLSLGEISATNSIAKEGMTLGQIAALGGAGDVDIKRIIADLIPAFSTSIWGLIAAFIITAWSKCIYAKEDSAIDARINNRTPEEYIYDIANAISEQAIQNKQYNERLNDSINGQSKILETFVNNFVDKMDEIFKGMGKSIKDNITEFGEKQFRNSSEVLETVVKKMSDSSDKLMSQQTASMSAIVENTNNEISKVSKALSDSIAAINKDSVDAVKQVMDAQNTTIESAVNNTNEKVKELSTTFTSNITAFNTDTVKVISDMIAALKTQMQAITDSSIQSISNISATQEAKLSTLVDNQTEFTTSIMASTTEMNKQVTDEIRTSLSSLVASLQASIKTQCEALAKSIVDNTTLLKDSYEFIESHIAVIRTNYEQAELAYTGAVQNAHDYNESIEQKIKALDASLKVLNTTNTNVSEIAEVVKERYEKIEHLITNINEMSTAIATLQKLESQLNKINQKVA